MQNFKPPSMFSKLIKIICNFLIEEIHDLAHTIFKATIGAFLGTFLISYGGFTAFFHSLNPQIDIAKTSTVESVPTQNTIANKTNNEILHEGYSLENNQYCRKPTSSIFYWLPIYSTKKYNITTEKFQTIIQVTDPQLINPPHAVIFLLKDNNPVIHFIMPTVNKARSQQLVQFEYLSTDSNGNPQWIPQQGQVLKAPIDLSQDTSVAASIITVNETDVRFEIDLTYYDSISGAKHFQSITSETIPNIISLYSQNDFTFGTGSLKGQCILIKEGFNS
ncbi:MAG TPA: hypothetical protein VG895_01425 [Patescibacteria group bacterium]|nr:hypothetical protein [Patescibacteria group bacterium]